MHNKIIMLIISILTIEGLCAQNVNKINFPRYAENTRMEMRIPNQINGFITLKGDLHTHTYFSDGSVSPDMRVDEAWKTGLDVLAITDHIEYKTNREYITGDENTSYNLAKKRAVERGIILIKGTEITRKQPIYGHFNALFVKDSNKLKVDDPKAAIEAAISQGAFVLWNHPAWAVDTCRIHEFQENLFKNKMIHGIEVFNNTEFYPRALRWAHEKNLTVFSNSDVHTSIYANDGVHGAGCAVAVPYRRPMTIIFAKDRSQASIKEAMFSRRTLAFFDGYLAGDKQLLMDFCLACLSVSQIAQDDTHITYRIDNRYDIPFLLSYGKSKVLLSPNRSLDIKLEKTVDKLKLDLENVFVDEFQTLSMSLSL